MTALGHGQALADAETRAGAGDLRAASETFEELAGAIGERMPRVANAMLLQAARLASEDNDRQRAGELLVAGA